jgi:hypothetical protein
MNQEVRYSSLKDSIFDAIGNFLYDEKFNPCEITKVGILNVIDMIIVLPNCRTDFAIS